MRSITVLTLAAALFCSSCAYQGTIVSKQFRPLPFPDSLGIYGIYDFVLRDRDGIVHRQMVTPEVFARYREGDYFDDLKWPRLLAPHPTVLPPIIPPRLEEIETHYRTAQPIEPPPGPH